MKLLMGVMLICFSAQSYAESCSLEKMNELRAAASSLDSKTVALSEELGRCPEFHDEALLWAALYYNQNGLYRESGIVSNEVTQSDTVTDRYQILAQAGQGQYQRLQALITEKKNGYYGDAESHLILARALIRARKNQEAFVQYAAYLSLKPDDTDVRIEEAYAHLWSDDWRAGQKRFNYLSLQSLNPNQKKLVQEGLLQAEKIRQRQIQEGSAQGNNIPLGFERVWNSYRSFSRQSLASGYYASAYHLDAAVMTLASDDSATGQTAGEILLSKNFSFNKGVDVFAKAGWLQGVGGNYELGIVISKTLQSGLRPMIGYESMPLVKFAPVPTKYTDWSQQAGFAGFKYKDRFEYRLYVLSATEQGYASKQSLSLEMPIKSSPEMGELKFKILAENLQAQEYSSYIYSPHDSTIVLPGLQWKVTVDEDSRVETNLNYGFVSETLNEGAAGSTTQTLSDNSSGQVFGFGLNYQTKMDLDLDAKIKFDYVRTSSGGSVSYQAGVIYIGLVWYPDADEKGSVQ